MMQAARVCPPLRFRTRHASADGGKFATPDENPVRSKLTSVSGQRPRTRQAGGTAPTLSCRPPCARSRPAGQVRPPVAAGEQAAEQWLHCDIVEPVDRRTGSYDRAARDEKRGHGPGRRIVAMCTAIDRDGARQGHGEAFAGAPRILKGIGGRASAAAFRAAASSGDVDPAKLVAVGIADIGQVDLSHSRLARARRSLDRGSAVCGRDGVKLVNLFG
jgi:hypothetical protein